MVLNLFQRVAIFASLLLFIVGCEYEPTVDLPAQASNKKGDTKQKEPNAPKRKELAASQLGETKEARAFIADRKFSIYTEDISKDELETFVDDCYSAGATEVIFAGIEKLGALRSSSWLVIKLPDDAAARGKVVEVFNELYSKYMFQDSPGEDRGQTYLDVGLD